MRKILEGLFQSWRRIQVAAPLVALAFGVLAGALWRDFPWWSVLIFALGISCARFRWKWWAAMVVLALVISWRSDFLERPVRESLSQARSELVKGTLTVGAVRGSYDEERTGVLRFADGEEKKVMVMRASAYQAGEILEIRGKLFVPDRMRNPGEFSQRDIWSRQSIHGGLSINHERSIGLAWQAAPRRWAEQMRVKLREGITRGLDEDDVGRSVIQAMILGEKPPGDSEVSKAFRNSGAMHVFAVSGLHVTLVGGLIWFVLANTPLSRRASIFLILLGMLAYSLVTGARPPAVRATLMATCFLSAFLLRRRPSLFNALALSFILTLLWNPGQVREIGFQLSYGVIVAIGLGVDFVYRFTGKIAEVDSFFPVRLLDDGQRRWLGVRRYFAGLGATSMAAWLGSLPLMVWHFGIVTPIAVFTSLLLIPMTVVILAGGFASTFTGTFFPSLGGALNQVNSTIARGAFHSADAFAKVPFGHWKTRRRTPADWVIFDGQDGGAASYLSAGNGVMIDVGNKRFYYRSLRSILNRWGAGVGTIALTHPDGDHVGAAPLILSRGHLAKAVIPMSKALSPSYREFIDRAEGEACELFVGKVGARYDLGDGAVLEIIREGQPADRGVADNRIMVMRVHWRGWRILITGDLGTDDELQLLDSGADLGADVVLLGRHEYGSSSKLDFLEATGAEVIIISSARFPGYEKIPERWCRAVELAGYSLFNQAETGAVMMDVSKRVLRVTSYLKPTKKHLIKK